MIDGIIAWSLRRRLIVVLAAVGLMAWGFWQSTKVPIDVFPNLTAPSVTVIVEAHGMAPEEVESQVTYPIEAVLNGATSVRRVRSNTGIGNAVIYVEFEWGTDVYLARQIVSEKLQLVALPPGVERPILGPIASVMGEIMYIAVSSDTHTPVEIRTEVDWNVRRRLLGVRGIAQVVPIGGGVKQYQVLVDPLLLSSLDVPLNQVSKVLSETNENVSAGFFSDNGREYLIYGLGRIDRVEDITNTQLVKRDGKPITIGDVAEVKVGPALKRGEGSYNGQRAVVIGIKKQPEANTLALTADVDHVLDDVEASLPAGMTLSRDLFRQADFIDVSIRNVSEALRDGAILVILILLVFLANIRPTFIAALAIPLSLIASVLAIKFLGGTINTMTLGGMVIAVGAIVDDAIVDVENVVRRLRLNRQKPVDDRQTAFDVVFEASREVRSSIVFATFVIILVFSPLFFLSGVEGRLLQPLGEAFVVSLVASLVVALTVTPALCLYLLPNTKATEPGESRLLTWLKKRYEPILRMTVTKWRVVSGVSVVAFVTAVFLSTLAGRSFLPEFNEGALTIGAVTLPGTSLETTDEIGFRIEEALLKHPETKSTARRTGRAELDEHAQKVNSSEIEVQLEMGDRSKAEMLEAMRADLNEIPGVMYEIGQPISHRIDHMLSGTRAAIAIKIFGSDLYELRRIAKEVEHAATHIDGVVDLNVEQQMDIPFLLIDFDRAEIARYGMHVADVAETVETAFLGHEVTRVIEGERGFDLVVRYPESAKSDLATIRQTLITTPSGARVPLHGLADIRRDRRPNSVSRENAQRKIVVSCNVANADLVRVVDGIRAQVEEEVDLPDGYRIEYGGQFESASEAGQRLIALTLIVIVGILLLLFLSIGSLRDSLLVMVNLPLALIGGVIGIFVSGGVLSVASFIGFITLFGIATRNGLLLITHVRHLALEEDAEDLKSAVVQGAMERLAPILMTALASGLGLIPLALNAGDPGSEIQAPMAIVILFGLLTSTVLNMIVVPALYLRFGELHYTWKKKGLEP